MIIHILANVIKLLMIYFHSYWVQLGVISQSGPLRGRILTHTGYPFSQDLRTASRSPGLHRIICQIVQQNDDGQGLLRNSGSFRGLVFAQSILRCLV